MINLLPYETRVDTMYARRNSLLLKWTVALAMGLVGVGLIIGAGSVYLAQTVNSQEKKLHAAETQLNSQNITETQKTVDQISSNVKLTTQVLSREVLFSKLLRQLGAALPANTSLQELQIDKLQGGLSMVALSRDISSAAQIQINLQDPNNKVFEKDDIESINCLAETDKQKGNYPCVVHIKALFLKNNPYLYISPTNKVVKP